MKQLISYLLLLFLFSSSFSSSTNFLVLEGAIFGNGRGGFCDAFYYAFGNGCDGTTTSCSFPLSREVCSFGTDNYGEVNNSYINTMHVNYFCSETNVFLSADFHQTDGDILEVTCPQSPSLSTLPSPHLSPLSPSPLFPVEYRTPRIPSKSLSLPSSGLIVDLGVVIGGVGSYCDAYFKSAPLCTGKKKCVLPITGELCSIGAPNTNTTLNYMHIMYSCGDSDFRRVSVAQTDKVAVIAC
uniref:SUEL-type lectin domain-containing protein n=1 Tax=Paramoeba aestuarina TaxID=180227 RepID=A0A7S4JGT6_9EUKA